MIKLGSQFSFMVDLFNILSSLPKKKRMYLKHLLKHLKRKLSFRLHPDKSKDDPETAQRKFMEMQEAFEILSDPVTKGVLDEAVKTQIFLS